jgi:hypothetical protein
MNAITEIDPMVRRFELPDLSRHGKWIMPRLLQAFPHLNERSAAGFLSSIIYNNEHLFLYQPHGVALAQVVSSHTLMPKPVIWERFVWVEDQQDKDQINAAASFYDHFAKWGKAMDVEIMIVEELTDVPHELIKTKVGRVFSRQQQFARL